MPLAMFTTYIYTSWITKVLPSFNFVPPNRIMEATLHFGILIFLVNFLRYVIVAGVFFYIFYVLFRKSERFKKLQPKFPQWKDYRREILSSTLSCVVFGIVGWIAYKTPSARPIQFPITVIEKITSVYSVLL